MFAHIALISMTLLGPGPTQDLHIDSEPTVRVDAAEHTVTVTVGPLRVAPATGYHHQGPDTRVTFPWPEDGWVQGYSMELVDSSGRALPNDMLHHVGLANLERRHLVYPIVERLFAAGSETEEVSLPSWMGVSMRAEQNTLVYLALVNPSTEPIEGVSLRMTFDWRPLDSVEPVRNRAIYPRRFLPYSRHRPDTDSIVEVVPVTLSANPNDGYTSMFDIPSGRSEKTSEFTLPVGGRFRALGAHMHDHAVEMRLEDVETGDVLARLEAHTEPDGRLLSIDITRFLLKPGGLRLEADRRYRIVAVYDNRTGQAIPDGAMGYVAGPFAPDDLTAWPEIEPTDPMYARDWARLTEARDPEVAPAHMGPAEAGDGASHHHAGPTH